MWCAGRTLSLKMVVAGEDSRIMGRVRREAGGDGSQRERGERRLSDGSAKSERAFCVGEGCDEATAACERSRKRTEVEARNDGECTEGADEELVEIVAGDVFDDATAALGESAGAGAEFGADQEVSRGAVQVTQRGVDAACDCAAGGAA